MTTHNWLYYSPQKATRLVDNSLLFISISLLTASSPFSSKREPFPGLCQIKQNTETKSRTLSLLPVYFIMVHDTTFLSVLLWILVCHLQNKHNIINFFFFLPQLRHFPNTCICFISHVNLHHINMCKCMIIKGLILHCCFWVLLLN